MWTKFKFKLRWVCLSKIQYCYIESVHFKRYKIFLVEFCIKDLIIGYLIIN